MSDRIRISSSWVIWGTYYRIAWTRWAAATGWLTGWDPGACATVCWGLVGSAELELGSYYFYLSLKTRLRLFRGWASYFPFSPSFSVNFYPASDFFGIYSTEGITYYGIFLTGSSNFTFATISSFGSSWGGYGCSFTFTSDLASSGIAYCFGYYLLFSVGYILAVG